MPSSVRRIAIAGGRGFLGQRLIKAWKSRGDSVLSFVREASIDLKDHEVSVSLIDTFTLATHLKKFRPTEVFYLAAKPQPGRTTDDFTFQFQESIEPMIAFAQSLPEGPELRAAFFFGSCEEYGNGAVPFREEQTPISFSSYGWSKIASHFAISYLLNLRRIPFVWVRPFLLFGPGQRAPLFLPQLIRAALENRSIELTAGEQTRDFIFVEDVVEMILRMMENPSPLLGSAINIGSGQGRRLRDVGDMVLGLARELGVGKVLPHWGALPYRENEAMEFYASMEKWRRHFGRIPLTNWQDSLRQTLAWEKENVTSWSI